MSSIVLTDLSKHPMVLQTWPERPKSHGENCFFQSKLQVFPDSERICSLARSAGECWPYRKGVFSTPEWGLWVLKFSPIFGVLSIISATDMLESHSTALKTRILA